MKIRTALIAFFMVEGTQAKDLGRHGPVFVIQEESLLKVLERRLHEAKRSGKLAALEKKMQAHTKAKIERPKPVLTLSATQEPRSFLYDPSLILKKDLKDHKGRVFYKKGTRINPLDQVAWGAPWVFIDGDCPDQVAWALSHPAQPTVILTNGAPLKISQEHGQRVFFDQGGLLVKRFGIRQVPCRISQQGRFLLVEEVRSLKAGSGR